MAGDLEVEYCEGRLHDHPERLRDKLNERIAATPGARTILLAYGRCSNGTAGLDAGPHRLVLPAVDDCIAILLGSRDEYLRQFNGCPGTYYYTRGWIEYIRRPLSRVPRDDPELRREEGAARSPTSSSPTTGAWRSSTPAPTTSPTYDDYLRTVCEFYDLPLEVLPGSLRLLEKLVGRRPDDGEFITVAPGETLEERLFWAASKG